MSPRNKRSLGRLFGLVLLSVISVFVFKASSAEAASLYLNPQSGSYATGATFSVTLFVESSDQPMNGVSAGISFPASILHVTSISKAGSIVTVWAQEPSFSNTSGNISLEGVALNGYTGSAGKIITVTFRAKAPGNAPVVIQSGSVLAHDGSATNILKSKSSAQFLIASDSVADEPALEVVDTNTARKSTISILPQITSQTHPNPEGWYSSHNIKLAWKVPDSISDIRLALDKNSKTVPSESTTASGRKEYGDIDDGIWYFHLRFGDGQGFGPVATRKIQIDSEAPESFTMTEIEREDLTDPIAQYVFAGSDRLSGLSHIDIRIGTESPIRWEYVKDATFTTNAMAPGIHSVEAKLFDKAGNYKLFATELRIMPLQAPVLKEYSREITSDEVMTVKGETAYPNADVTVYYQRNQADIKHQNSKADEHGQFVFSPAENLPHGSYSIWAEVTNARGAKSLPSEKIMIKVSVPALFSLFGVKISYINMFIVLLAVIVTLLIILIWKIVRTHGEVRHVLRNVAGAEVMLHKTFSIFKDNIQDQIASLEMTDDLSNREKKIYKNLAKALSRAEKYAMKDAIHESKPEK